MDNSDVLIVDGDACSLGLMAQGLARQGLQVRSAAGSDQALAEMSRSLPSLVISDVEPDGADGLRILEAMRQNPRTAGIPVLLLAKNEWTRRRSEARKLGAQEVLRKPLFVQDIAVLGRLHAGHDAAEESFTEELGELRCHTLVRSLLSGGRSGTLSFDPAGARIYFQDGRIVDAVLPPLEPERALWRILTFKQGRFRLRFGQLNRDQTLSIDLRELTGRGFEHVRRWDDLARQLGSGDEVLEVDFRLLSQTLEAVPPAVWPLVRLFDGQRTISQVIDAFGVDDVISAQAVIKLQSLGLLKQVGATPAAPLQLTDVLPVTDAEGSAPATQANLEAFFTGDVADEQTLAQVARVEEATAAATIEALSPDAVSVALGFGETPPSARRRQEVSALAETGGASVEDSFFGSSVTVSAVSLPSLAAERALPVATPAAARTPRRWLFALAGAGLAAAVIAAWWSWSGQEAGQLPLQPPEPPVKTAVLAPAPLVAPPELASPEATALTQAGQKAYDAHDFAQAEQIFTKAVQTFPSNLSAQLYLGLSRYELGRTDQAVDPLEKARALDPKNERAKVMLGAVYQELGKTGLARDRYQEYLDLQPQGTYAGEVRTLLARLPVARGG